MLRDPGERDTVGGAEVLDAAPSGRARDAAASLALPLERRLLAGHRWLGVDALGPRAGLGAAEAAELADDLVRSGAAVRIGGWLVAPDTVTKATTNPGLSKAAPNAWLRL